MAYQITRTSLAMAILIFAVATSSNVHAQTYSVLSNFPTSGGPAAPAFPGVVAQGRDGSLYSTTMRGGMSAPPGVDSPADGTIFRVTPSGTLTVVYTFRGTVAGNPSSPKSGLTLGTDGFFYGAAAGSNGKIFKADSSGNVTVLYSLAASDGSGAGTPIRGTDGNLYGATQQGGGVYKLTSGGKFTVIHASDINDGYLGDVGPLAPLFQASDGDFYGTTHSGVGTVFVGSVFKVTGTGDFTYIYKFDNTHGATPIGPVIQGSDGNFYGTTSRGGSANFGVVFMLKPSGELTVLHNFNGTDGKTPDGGLVQANNGVFYGVASAGGTLGFGTIYKITSTGTFSVLHNFDNTTGATPDVTLVQHTNGLLYADTSGGGASGVGVFYSLNDSLQPFVSLMPISGQVGVSIGILGQGFTGTTDVSFNGAPAAFTVVSDTFLTVTVPSHGSTGNVTVTTPTGTLTSNKVFTVIPNRATLGSAASIQLPFVAGGSIVTAYGTDLATGIASATTLPLPNTLLGTSVNIVDSSGASTSGALFYVSPGQVNFEIPSGVANGIASITIASGDGTKSVGTVKVAAVAPGLFVVNSAGLVAANVITIVAGGAQVFSSCFQVVNGAIVPLPVNLGPPAQQVFLVLFGTGISGRSSLANVSVEIGGLSLPVAYAGLQGDAGLDQVDVQIPMSLAGSGDATISVIVDGVPSNTAHITIK